MLSYLYLAANSPQRRLAAKDKEEGTGGLTGGLIIGLAEDLIIDLTAGLITGLITGPVGGRIGVPATGLAGG
jgi:predicted lipid-binding transport protein (Tim44 family)